MVHPTFNRLSALSLLSALLLIIAACGGAGTSPSPTDPDLGRPGEQQDPDAPNHPDGPGAGLTPATPVASTNIGFEPRERGRIWVVNQDNDSVSVIDPVTRTRLAEIPVGAAPRTLAIARDGQVWVASRDAATLSRIDPQSLQVEQIIALPFASQPFAVIASPADGHLWVSLQARGEIVKIDSASGATAMRIAAGPNVRHLSMPAMADRLLAPRFITPPMPGESTPTPRSQVADKPVGGEVLVFDPASGALSHTVTLRASTKSDSSVSARGIPNYVGAATISPDGTEAWVPSKQDNIFRGSGRLSAGGVPQGPLTFESAVRAVSSKLTLGNVPAEESFYRIDHDNSGLASAAVHDPQGVYVIVALETSREIALIDPLFGREVAKYPAGRAPQGVSISADGRLLAVNNFMDRTVGLYDLEDLVGFGPGQTTVTLLANVPAITREKLASDVLKGKQLFHDAADPRLSVDKYLSCASCHNDGGHDGRVWDFTTFDGATPAEGLRNTISLRGRAGGPLPLHWSGNFDEVQDFETQIRTFARGTGLIDVDAQAYAASSFAPADGSSKAGLSEDLDALAAYVMSLNEFAPSPWRTADRQLTAAGARGSSLFTSKGCATCHAGDAFAATDNRMIDRRRDIGTIKPTSGTRLGGPLDGIDVPTLRDVWTTAPYLHDGSAATLADAVDAHDPAVLHGGSPTAAERDDLVEFLRQIGSEEPARQGP